MALTRQEVEQIATLARLDLTEDQIGLYQEQLSAILGYAERLNELDLEGVEATTQPVPLTNVMRADVVETALPTEKALANAPRQAQNQFVIQAVLDEG
ncbi:MAG: Asp-tRNA(Asn)/Glu-tRNA(Gln) amidotransferase subunit GatC [Candidatus Promineifilaceae bacterium]